MKRARRVVLVAAAAAAITLPGALPRVEAAAGDPATSVDPFVGTGRSSVPGSDPGNVDAFPGATLPFGMVQWSPDTAPDRPAGGGYAYRDRSISGFSLTHASGPGCPVYGDVPILPTVGPVSDPDSTVEPFDHHLESASPGTYRVTLGNPGVAVELTATTRTGLGSFTFPPTAQANVLVKGDGSAAGVDRDSIEVVGDDEITGAATSGHFCQTAGTYTVYFALQFDRPFQSAGTWNRTGTSPGSRACTSPSESGVVGALSGSSPPGGHGCGAWVTFDTTQRHTVLARVGVSFTSVAEAEANLAAEEHGWDLRAAERRATDRWDAMLDRIRVTGGTTEQQRVFATALYHSLLHPNVFNDADGSYTGFDLAVHNTGGRTQYANFSNWDIYRSEVPLLALIAPHEASDMMQSLLLDAEQAGGGLPKWPYADHDSGQMNGDSADPVIASAYAFGARRFDAPTALAEMLKGASDPTAASTLYPERQDLAEYEARGWVHRGSYDLTSFPYTVGGSETLEYAIDDFSVSRLAAALGDPADAATFARRGGNWHNLFNPATGYLGARDVTGAFPRGPAFQRSSTPGVGQDGWEEGNAVQYTWSVPQDLRALFDDMGGDAIAVARLDRFFTQLNGGRYQPYDWAGNEPALGIPWEYDYAGAPWRTQDIVRRIATTLYTDSPGGEPGNDDLGAMSSWYVWAAIGLYPETPGVGDLVLSSPIFAKTVIAVPGRPAFEIDAPGATTTNRFIQTASVSRPWLPVSAVQAGGVLRITLGPRPNTAWAAAPADAPPSFSP
jgi:predicted alpha-1,2-mannosidase